MERLLADAEKFSGVKYDIDNLGDVYQAIHVIQGELGLTGVAAAEAKTTLQGSAGAMKASWENLMAALTTGEGLELAMENMGSSVSAFMDNVVRMGGTLAKQLPDVIKGLAGKVAENAPQFIASGLELMLKLAIGVVNGIPKLTAKAPEMGRKFKEAFSKIDWATLGMDLIKGIVTGVNSAREKVWAAIKEALSGLGSKIWAWIKEQIRGGAGGGDGGGGGSGPSVNKSPVKSAGIYGNAMDAAPYAPGRAAGNSVSAADLEQLLQGLRIDVDVELAGDTAQIFKVVRTQAVIRTKATGKPAMA